MSLLFSSLSPLLCDTRRFAVANYFNKGEDAHGFRTIDVGDENGPVHGFGIFDGHNGPEGAVACKTSLLELIESECLRLQEEGSSDEEEDEEDESAMRDWPAYLDTAIRSAFQKVDTIVRQNYDAGSTATICLIREHESGRVFIKTAHVGDSRAVAGDAIDSCFDLSMDHKVNDINEKLRITVCEKCNAREDLSHLLISCPNQDEIAQNRKLSHTTTLNDLSAHGAWPGSTVQSRSEYDESNASDSSCTSSETGSEDGSRSASPRHASSRGDFEAEAESPLAVAVAPPARQVVPVIRIKTKNGEEIKVSIVYSLSPALSAASMPAFLIPRCSPPAAADPAAVQPEVPCVWAQKGFCGPIRRLFRGRAQPGPHLLHGLVPLDQPVALDRSQAAVAHHFVRARNPRQDVQDQRQDPVFHRHGLGRRVGRGVFQARNQLRAQEAQRPVKGSSANRHQGKGAEVLSGPPLG